MALPELTKKLVEKTLTAYCENRFPSHVRDQVRLVFKFRGNNVTLLESRPSIHTPEIWVDVSIAQFRFDESKKWTLFCCDRNSKWHIYDAEPSNFEKLLKEVDADPTGIFWG